MVERVYEERVGGWEEEDVCACVVCVSVSMSVSVCVSARG